MPAQKILTEVTVWYGAFLKSEGQWTSEHMANIETKEARWEALKSSRWQVSSYIRPKVKEALPGDPESSIKPKDLESLVKLEGNAEERSALMKELSEYPGVQDDELRGLMEQIVHGVNMHLSDYEYERGLLERLITEFIIRPKEEPQEPWQEL